MILLIAVCVAVALFTAIALVLVIAGGERSSTASRLAELRVRARDQLDDPYPSRPAGVQGMLAAITQPLAPFRNWLKSNDEELTYRLSTAGFRKPEDADTFLSCKMLAPIVGVLLATFAPLHDILLYALLLGVAMFFAPDLYLFYAVSKRQTKIARALPDTLDLLMICMEAGLGIDQAVVRIASELSAMQPELSEELFIISREQRAGKPRLEAWRSMADRVDLDTVRQFVAMLVQTERLGTPIARALGQFADGLRTKRLMQAEEHAAKTTIKLIFPLTLFIFPAIFIVLLGPGVISIMKTFEDMGR
jgi:tight adherence protein C